ncbi:MAG: hypothetical protein JNG88_09590 [Phycisphaerales bacterium]|nr:hypothetical protein [Phycisphaerales bacterium]
MQIAVARLDVLTDELIVRHGWRRVVETPISFRDRAAGQTKLNVAEQIRYLRHLSRLYPLALRRWLGGRT